MQSFDDKENSIDIDPSKLSLKERIKFFAQKNKTGGMQPRAGAAAAAAAITAAAAASAATASSMPPSTGAASIIATPAAGAGAPLDHSSAAAAVVDSASDAAGVVGGSVAPSRTRALATALEQTLGSIGSGGRVALGGGGAAARSIKCLSLAADATELGVRLYKSSRSAGVRVEAVDPAGAAAGAGVVSGDYLVRAPFSLDGAPADVEDAARAWISGAAAMGARDFEFSNMV
jgi:hypothetical protein